MSNDYHIHLEEELSAYVDHLNATTGSVRIIDQSTMESMQRECEERAYHEWSELIAADPAYIEWIESINARNDNEIRR